MLTIKKQFIQPMTYLYTGIGVAVFGATIAALSVIHPQLNNDQSISLNPEKSSESSQDKPASIRTASTTSASPSPIPVKANNDSEISSIKPQSQNVTPPTIGMSSDPQTPTTVNPPVPQEPVANEPETIPTDPPAEPIDTTEPPVEQPQPQPSLLENVVGGVLGAVDAVI